MDIEKLKDSVLMNLRSVILSSKGGVPLNRLQNDYRQLIGSNIPFTQLGYTSLENFIQNIPQVVRLKRNPDGQLFVEAVADSSTLHLQKLISKQKGAGVSKYSAKPYGKKSSSVQKSILSTSKEKEASLEKDKIIEDLKSKLEREEQVKHDFASQIGRLSSLLSTCQNSLVAEQETNRLLKNQIDVLRSSSQTANHNGVGTSEVGQSTKPKTQEASGSCSSVDKDNCAHCELYGMYKQQCTEISTLKTLLQRQNIRMEKIEVKFNQQSQKFENYAAKFASLVNVDGLTQAIMKNLKVGPPNIVDQNTTKNGNESESSGSALARNSPTTSSQSSSTPAVSQIREPTRASTTTKKKKKKKPKVATENKSL